jgi:anti-anti-sigma factor
MPDAAETHRGKRVMRDLQFETKQLQGVEIVSLSGAVEPMAFTELAASLGRLIHEASPCLVLDCQRVSYIGSAQLKELLDFARYARTRGGDIKCCYLSPAIRDVATLIGNGESLECYDDVLSAVSAFRAQTEQVTAPQ